MAHDVIFSVIVVTKSLPKLFGYEYEEKLRASLMHTGIPSAYSLSVNVAATRFRPQSATSRYDFSLTLLCKV